jgi:3-hydroxyacyl-CoA dehydrogenase/enoyl-CoA hydratase/3-hydroxybutyryl-CoA epimerase
MMSMSGEGAPVCMKGSRGIEALDRLIGAGREGRIAGKGIYDYAEGKARIWQGLAEMFPVERPVPVEDVEARLICTQSLEAVRALDDGTVTDPLTADMAAVTGWGYPVHFGGPFAYIDTIGADIFVARCDELAAGYGARFAVPDRLRAMAASGSRFHAL